MDAPDGPAFTYHARAYRLFQWQRSDTGAPAYGVKCPNCGRVGTLSDHDVQVDAQGRPTVSPSIICPRGCGFHGWLRDGACTDA